MGMHAPKEQGFLLEIRAKHGFCVSQQTWSAAFSALSANACAPGFSWPSVNCARHASLFVSRYTPYNTTQQLCWYHCSVFR